MNIEIDFNNISLVICVIVFIGIITPKDLIQVSWFNYWWFVNAVR